MYGAATVTHAHVGAAADVWSSTLNDRTFLAAADDSTVTATAAASFSLVRTLAEQFHRSCARGAEERQNAGGDIGSPDGTLVE
jgi:hypothetical protein